MRLSVVFFYSAITFCLGLSACAPKGQDRQITRAQRDSLCKTFWDIQDSNLTLLHSQLMLMASIHRNFPDLPERDVVANYDDAGVTNAASRKELGIVCGVSRP